MALPYNRLRHSNPLAKLRIVKPSRELAKAGNEPSETGTVPSPST